MDQRGARSLTAALKDSPRPAAEPAGETTPHLGRFFVDL